MSGGGKGGKQSSEIPSWAKPYAQEALANASKMQNMDYMPFIGGDVAAVNPFEMQAMQNTAGAANAFGMGGGLGDPMAGLPDPITLANGQQAYSSAPLFFEAVEAARQAAPRTFQLRDEMIDRNALPGTEGQYFDANNPDHMAAMEQNQMRQSELLSLYPWLESLPSYTPIWGGGFNGGFQ